MHRDERDEAALAGLRAATEALAPDPGLTDAVVSAAVSAAARHPADDLQALADATRSLDAAGDLQALADATRSLDAADGLTDAVMARVKRAGVEGPSWMDGVVRTGPVVVGLAALAAVASLVLGFVSESDVEAAMASSVEAVEVLE